MNFNQYEDNNEDYEELIALADELDAQLEQDEGIQQSRTSFNWFDLLQKLKNICQFHCGQMEPLRVPSLAPN